jgi:hypothetical protein
MSQRKGAMVFLMLVSEAGCKLLKKPFFGGFSEWTKIVWDPT